MHKRWRQALGLALTGMALATQAATVTYTFTEFDNNGAIVYQMRHSLDHFLNPSTLETVSFDLGDLIVDPWAANGRTTEALESQGFGAFFGFITFNGTYLCSSLVPVSNSCSFGDRLSLASYDMHVIDGSPGSWTDGLERVDVQVSDNGPPPGRLPEPGSMALLGLGMAALRVSVRTARSGQR